MRRLIGACIGLWFLGWPDPPQSPPEPPKEIRRTLDSLHPGWHFAQLDTFNTQQLKADERPDWVTGDLDAQGRPDYVVQIVDPRRPEDSQQLVLGFIHRGSGFIMFSIDSTPESKQIYLRVNRRGTRGFDIETHRWFIYQLDVLSILYDQTAGVDCPYAKGRFSCTVSGD
jgi:hypothetical protein